MVIPYASFLDINIQYTSERLFKFLISNCYAKKLIRPSLVQSEIFNQNQLSSARAPKLNPQSRQSLMCQIFSHL